MYKWFSCLKGRGEVDVVLFNPTNAATITDLMENEGLKIGKLFVQCHLIVEQSGQ